MSDKKPPKADKPKRRKKNPAGRVIQRELIFALSDAQQAVRAKEAGKLSSEKDELMREKKRMTDDLSSQIKDRTARISTLLQEVNTGTELRLVDCIEHKNFHSNKVEFWFDGEKYGEREMEAKDHQIDIEDKVALKKTDVATPAPETQAAVAKDVSPTKRRKKKELIDPPADAEAEVADVIREETSKKSKWSSVDGARG